MHIAPAPSPPDLGLGSWPRRRSRITPTAMALTQGERQLTYAALALRTEQLAAGIASKGIKHGDRVAYVGLNDLATFETMFAAQRLGAVFVPINHRLAVREVQYVLEDCGASLLVVGPGVADLARELVLDLPDCVQHLVTTVDALGSSAIPYSELFIDDAEPVDAAVSLDDAALFLYTSGTTGRPKAAVLTHGNLTWNTVNQLAHLDVLSTDLALCIAPLFHAVGLGQITLPVLFKGGTVEVVPRFDAGVILALIEEKAVASFSCVPTMLQLMTEHPSWGSADLGSLRYVNYGGSPVPQKIADAWADRGVRLQQGYGMTEAAPGVAMAPAEGIAGRTTSVGVPHFFTDIAFLGEDLSVREVGPDDRGELLIRGPHVFAGYWERPDDTAASTVRQGVSDWYRTGDVLATDVDGWLSVVDRVKDLIISGGENIYPAEIEALLVALPQVRSAAVVARPDDRWGEVGVAYVETAPGQTISAEQVTSYLAKRLARFKLPQQTIIVSDLPRNATGKVLRASLRDDAALRTEPKETSS